MCLSLVALVVCLTGPSTSLADTRSAVETIALPKTAEEAYARGDVAEGNRILNELIADNPGDVDLAVVALHRIFIEEFLELLDIDWVGMQMRRRLTMNHQGDREKVRQYLSGHIRGALLRELEDNSGHPVPPMNALRRATFASPIDAGSEHYQFLIRETLVRRSGYPKLTPREDWPDATPLRLLALRRAGLVAPDHPAVVEASVLLMFIYRQLGRGPEAIDILDQLTEGFGDDPEFLLAEARFHDSLKSPRAGQLFRRLFQLLEDEGNKGDVWQRAQSYTNYLAATDAENSSPQLGRSALLDPQKRRDLAMIRDGRIGRAEQRIDSLLRETLEAADNPAYIVDDTAPDCEVDRNEVQGGRLANFVMLSPSLIDSHLISLDQSQLTGLRQLQERKCRIDRRAADLDAGSQAELLALFRRYPWALTAHRALLVYARRELEEGHTEAAQRSFSDVIEHAADPRLLSQARVGLWMALARHRDRSRLVAAFETTADDEKLPWMATEATAATIRRRLLDGMPQAQADADEGPALENLEPQLLKMPAVAPWPRTTTRNTAGLDMVSIHPIGSRVMLSSRNLLAWYDAQDTRRPMWTQIRPNSGQGLFGDFLGPLRPEIDADRIYTRWGYNGRASRLVALNKTTGDVVWGTEPSEGVPLGNPVFSGGQLYDASVTRGGHDAWKVALKLSCIDAASGKLIWNSQVIFDAAGVKNIYGSWQPVDWNRGTLGDVLAVRDGAVYCTPGGGLMARCDARDGRMEWMQTYVPRQGKLRIGPHGARPVPIGDVLICLPDDTDAMIGLDRRTGRVLWRNKVFQGREELGTFDDALIVHGKFLSGRPAIAAVDPRDGGLRWSTTLPEPSVGRPVRLGSSIYLGTGEQLRRFDAATGVEQEVRPWPKTDNFVESFTVDNHTPDACRLYLLTNDPCEEPPGVEESLAANAAPADGPFRLPLQLCWTIPIRDPKLFLPSDDTASVNKALIYSNEILTCVESTPRGTVAWRRIVGPGLHDVFYVDGKAVLFHYFPTEVTSRLVALDLATGNFTWKAELPAFVGRFGRSGKLFHAGHRDRLVTVDLTSGKLFSRQTAVPLVPELPEVAYKIHIGFGGGNVQIVCCTTPRDKLSTMHWLSCNPYTEQVFGSDAKLRGLGKDKDATVADIRLGSAVFGRRATYFTIHNRTAGRHGPEAYRCDHGNRTVRMLRPNASISQVDAPYVLMSVETNTGPPDNAKQRQWVVLSEDDPSYEFSLPAEDNSNMSLRNGRLFQIKRNQPRVLRIYDLQSRKLLVDATMEGSQEVRVLTDGPGAVTLCSRHSSGAIRLSQYDLTSGDEGPTSDIPLSQQPAGESSPPQVSGNMLLISDSQSVRAWAPADQ